MTEGIIRTRRRFGEKLPRLDRPAGLRGRLHRPFSFQSRRGEFDRIAVVGFPFEKPLEDSARSNAQTDCPPHQTKTGSKAYPCTTPRIFEPGFPKSRSEACRKR